MYPDLSYVFHDLLGTPADNWLSIFKTFGLLLVLAILSAAFILYHELRRKAREGLFEPKRVKIEIGKPPTAAEVASSGIWGFILGFKGVYAYQNFDALQADAGAVLLSTAGSWSGGLVLGVLFAAYRYWKGARQALPKPKQAIRKIYPHDRIGDITVIAAISGVVGAKLFAVIEDIPALLEDPVGTLLSGGGLAIYGGLIFGFLFVALYLRRKDIPLIHVLDAVAPALIIAYGVGRLGCHFSGDGDWGIVNAAAQPDWWVFPDWLWAYDYPHNVLQRGVPIEGCDMNYCTRLDPPVYPTPVYESLMAFAIGGILFGLRGKTKAYPGMLFCIYLMFNGIERFFIERVRINEVYSFLGTGLTQAQFIAVSLFLIGLAGTLWFWRRGQR